ncbi:CARDB domain-containing protein [Stenotrophomonas tuberculopleuritidis]|uniref:CARDB domain-containing protein n=1 Tax=Stenotrophomonas tuberculopleuritidis TaxID=3055079 RepID=UPI0026E541CF|nr:CARDB domain-containing protein [Stenotrophomonas sp. 704A1]
MRQYLRALPILLAGMAGVQSAHAQDAYTGSNFKFLYASNIIGNTDPAVRSQLTQLHNAGANVIPVSGWNTAELSSRLQALRQDPLLSRFKVLLQLNGPVYDAWYVDPGNACSPGNERLPNWLQQDLDAFAALALQNADIVVGYYTFDEPALPQPSKNLGICKRFQELVYERIRQADPDATARPVIIANLMGSLTDAQIQYAMSPYAQDVVFVDQYQNNLNEQIAQYQKWKRHGLLGGGMVPVLPAFNYNTCSDPGLRSSFRVKLEAALQAVYGEDRPRNLGSAYFAFWPGARPDYQFDGQNCPVIFNSVIDDLTHQPDLQVTRIETVPSQFRAGEPVRFRVTIRNAGNAPSPMNHHSVLVHEEGRCFDGGCQWGILTTSLAPGQQAIIDLSQGPHWTPSAGLHAVTAFADDADRIKELDEHNNELTREIMVGDLPDLQPYLLETIPASFKPGDAVTFRTAVTNRGSMPAPAGWLGTVYLVNGVCPPSGCPWGGLTMGLAPGESVWLPPSGPVWPAVGGQQEITSIVDDQGLIQESNEGNNQLARVIQVADKPDLRVISAQSQPVRPKAGDATSFSATIENVGSVAASAPWIGLMALKNGQCFTEGCVWGGLQNYTLPPGTNITIRTYNDVWRPTVGVHTIQLLIDDQNTVSESREDNNRIDITVTVD